MHEGINVLLAVMIVVSFLLAIPLHEVGHALMARWLGDRTPQQEGRLSLGLRSHIDPLGLLMCVILALQPIAAFPVGLGWGKPVKVDLWKTRVGANMGLLIVAIAGPLFSLIVGLVFAVIVRFAAITLINNIYLVHILQLLIVFSTVNIALAIFNLIPLYPLDGYNIVFSLLPNRQAKQFERSAPYGPLIILALFFFIPFLARLSGVGDFFLFQLGYYILDGALHVVSLVTNPFPGFDVIYAIYQS